MRVNRGHDDANVDPGMTHAQLHTLEALMTQGHASVSQLTDRLNMSVSAVSHLVQRLVDMGFVSRTEDETDRRQKNVALSRQGRSMIEKLMQQRFRHMRGSVEHLDDQLKTRLRAVLLDIVDAMQRLAEVKETGGSPQTRRVLAGMNLCGAAFDNEDLRGADMSGANLELASFCGARLQGASFRGSNLHRAMLERCQLRGATFSGANAEGARFTGADLTDASFAGANIDGADFSGANVAGATFVGSNVDAACFAGAVGGATAKHFAGASPSTTAGFFRRATVNHGHARRPAASHLPVHAPASRSQTKDPK